MYPSSQYFEKWCCRMCAKVRNRGFSREEGVIYDVSHSKDMENLKNDRSNVKNMVDDQKRSSEMLGAKTEICS